jgi:hypothetical protein
VLRAPTPAGTSNKTEQNGGDDLGYQAKVEVSSIPDESGRQEILYEALDLAELSKISQ